MAKIGVILLLGSNDEHAAAIINEAVKIINIAVGEMVKLSEEYRSEAYGFSSEREFINRAMEISTEHDAYEVLRRINCIEALLGRDRDEEFKVREERGERYASRPIDIDIIFYGDQTFDDSRLVIPYHFLDEREYALRPVAEIAPERKHPALDHTPREMLERLTTK
ncbi:MAG: 2-amino-4-hydroxy-6-hydroxymethyldihydropteridine diphosphokinase [Alistipes sp.]|nr:2-amino-4-hydroxy-6-hydroxymethyldihydropteridine diphosphokinase [Alistipes sp.]